MVVEAGNLVKATLVGSSGRRITTCCRYITREGNDAVLAVAKEIAENLGLPVATVTEGSAARAFGVVRRARSNLAAEPAKPEEGASLGLPPTRSLLRYCLGDDAHVDEVDSDAMLSATSVAPPRAAAPSWRQMAHTVRVPAGGVGEDDEEDVEDAGPRGMSGAQFQQFSDLWPQAAAMAASSALRPTAAAGSRAAPAAAMPPWAPEAPAYLDPSRFGSCQPAGGRMPPSAAEFQQYGRGPPPPPPPPAYMNGAAAGGSGSGGGLRFEPWSSLFQRDAGPGHRYADLVGCVDRRQGAAAAQPGIASSSPAAFGPAPAGASSGAQPADTQAMLQYLMLQQLAKIGSGEAADPSSATGAGRALRRLHAQQARVREKPHEVTAEFIEQVMHDLNVDAGDHWSFSDQTMAINWGKMKGLQRIHYHLGFILTHLLRREHQEAEAYVVQLMRCVHQVCLDSGAWTTGQHLLPRADPLEKPLFGGTQQELENIAAYTEALRKLRKSHGDTLSEPKGKGKGKDEKGGDGQ